LRALQTHEDLEIYRLSHDLAIEIHKVRLRLPKFGLYEERSQKEHLKILYETAAIRPWKG